jgi:Domain of unknown function (DUF1854)
MTVALRVEEEGSNEGVPLRTSTDGRLLAMTEGGAIAVRVRQCFPWSEPHRHLSLRDSEEREVMYVDDPAVLSETSRGALERAVAEAGFVLEVTRVVSIEEEVEIRQWSVETRHGERSFQTHLDDWPRVLPNGAILIRDVGGDLYRIVVAEMDRGSRELLWAFVD